MVNKKIVAGLLIVLAMLAIVVVASTKSPTITQDIVTPMSLIELPTSEQTTVPTLTLSDDANGLICQQPSAGNQYGGISGAENNPPKGTVIDPDLTKQYGRSTATGVCGTYWYIAGWWFNASEMAKLPSETILYGISPYAITEGSDGTGGREGNDNEDRPIPPVPEIATIVLVALGLFTILSWKKIKK